MDFFDAIGMDPCIHTRNGKKYFFPLGCLGRGYGLEEGSFVKILQLFALLNKSIMPFGALLFLVALYLRLTTTGELLQWYQLFLFPNFLTFFVLCFVLVLLRLKLIVRRLIPLPFQQSVATFEKGAVISHAGTMAISGIIGIGIYSSIALGMLPVLSNTLYAFRYQVYACITIVMSFAVIAVSVFLVFRSLLAIVYVVGE